MQKLLPVKLILLGLNILSYLVCFKCLLSGGAPRLEVTLGTESFVPIPFVVSSKYRNKHILNLNDFVFYLHLFGPTRPKPPFSKTVHNFEPTK